MLAGVSVPMPESRVRRKKGKHGIIYIYFVKRSFRDDSGIPKADEVLIGKFEDSTGRLIPNINYYTIYLQIINGKPCLTLDSFENAINNMVHTEETINLVTNKQNEYGQIYVLKKLSDYLGITNILKDVFKDNWTYILTIAFYMVCEGNIMSGITDWFEETNIDLVDKITDQMCSCLFAHISFDQKMNFFKQWITLMIENEFLAYDVTSISTYSSNLSDAEYGHNRDGDKLPQINFGMFYGQKSQLPVYYTEYQGSINDVSYLKYMLAHTQDLGIKNIEFILDRGFISQTNFEFMVNNHYNFIIPLSKQLKITQKLIDISINSMKKNENWINNLSLYGVTHNYNIYNMPLFAHIIYNPYKNAQVIDSFYLYLNKLEQELENRSKKFKITKKYTDHFDITKLSDEKINFVRNSAKIDESISHLGYIVYVTTNSSYTTEEIVLKYKTRDLIEKSFMCFKDDLLFKKLRIHFDQTASGKFFIGFIALILKSFLLHKTKSFTATKHLSIKEILRKLRRIKITYIDNKIIKSIPLSKQQRDIFNSIGLLVDDFIDGL